MPRYNTVHEKVLKVELSRGKLDCGKKYGSLRIVNFIISIAGANGKQFFRLRLFFYLLVAITSSFTRNKMSIIKQNNVQNCPVINISKRDCTHKAHMKKANARRPFFAYKYWCAIDKQ